MVKEIIIIILISCSFIQGQVRIDGELRKWHTVILTFEGPPTSEMDKTNPFLNYRLNIKFRKENFSITVPGYYAADGNASETSANKGNKWKVNFAPNSCGKWNYEVSFRKGKNIAVSTNEDEGIPLLFDGTNGTLEIANSNKNGRDFRSKGRLTYVGKRYLQFADSKEYFIKGGADSPENFLAYSQFDGTYSLNIDERDGEASSTNTKTYSAHLKDWREGDPTWKNGRGKGIIGAINYLASKGMNSVYFLTMNVQGDGKDVWPWVNENEHTRFDCSKLDQWEIVFSHMEKLGIMMHLVTQETENELLLDIGKTEVIRKLYYRELIARFGHHLAITWNLGEENGIADWTPKGQTDEDRKAMSEYLKTQNPYENFIVVHTHADKGHREKYLLPLLGYKYLDGPSLQVGNPEDVHKVTKRWIDDSFNGGKQWIVNIDEIGHHTTGAKPDIDDPDHDIIRREVLWGNLMAGGSGVEWYFGYEYIHNDLTCEDWRSRNNLWDQTRFALEFFQNNLPFSEMYSMDSLTERKDDYVFAKPGNTYVIYLPKQNHTSINLIGHPGKYSVKWFDPKNGGDLINGKLEFVDGDDIVSFGQAPSNNVKDWLVLLQK